MLMECGVHIISKREGKKNKKAVVENYSFFKYSLFFVDNNKWQMWSIFHGHIEVSIYSSIIKYVLRTICSQLLSFNQTKQWSIMYVVGAKLTYFCLKIFHLGSDNEWYILKLPKNWDNL